MRLTFIVCFVIGVVLGIALYQSLQREQALKQQQPVWKYRGELLARDECIWDVGSKLSIYADDFDLCASLMALPERAEVRLTW